MTPRIFALLVVQGLFTGGVCWVLGRRAERRNQRQLFQDFVDLILTDPLWTEEKIRAFREASK